MSCAFRTAVLVFGLSFSACQCQQPYSGAGLAVHIDIEDALTASCIVLEVRNTDGTLLDQSKLKRGTRKSYLVGISQGVLPTQVVLKARAMKGASGCNEPLTVTLDGEDKPASFVTGKVTSVPLMLACSTAAEKCDDGLDNNCNGVVDCAESSCQTKVCAGGGTCQSLVCSCPVGKKTCNGACIASADCCADGECTAISGQSCQSGACACATGQKVCGAECLATSACCTSAECLAPIVGQTCQSGACACPAGQKTCGARCIAAGSCCTDPDCAAVVPGQTCQTETCGCPTGQRVCGGACVVGTGCCLNADCGPGGTCATVTGVCTCGSGTTLCNGVCIPSANCCAAADCASPATCQTALGAICSTGACSYPSAAVGTACGSSDATNCNAADSCDGAGTCIDRVKAAAAICRIQGTNAICDPPETCNGVTAACPANAFSSTSTPCGLADSAACNAADTCDGAGGCVDRVKPAGTLCRVAGADPTCDPAEACNGIVASCPANVFPTSATACGSAIL